MRKASKQNRPLNRRKPNRFCQRLLSFLPTSRRRPLSSHQPASAVPLPSNEAERLAALNQYQILDTPPEEEFDELTELAAYICGTPIALISLIDNNRQWFKSKLGLESPETPKEQAFCAYAILRPDEVMVVPNACEDERFANNPLVTADPNIRFYAGTPLVTPEGFPLGTLCTIDRIPRHLTPQQLKALQALGRQVIAQMELRLKTARLEGQLKRYQEVEANLRISDAQVVDLLESMSDGFFTLNPQWEFTGINPVAAQIFKRQPEELLGQNIWQTFPEIVGSKFEREYRKAMSQQQKVMFEEFEVSLGQWLEVRAFPSYSGLSVFLLNINQRKVMEEAFRYQRNQTEDLLLNILPASIAEELKFDLRTIADNFEEVTILFADLVNFTQLASQLKALELVSLLNEIFSAFDRLTEQHGLEKIKTIGDAYLVVGGLPLIRADHAIAIANMALDMQAVLHAFNQTNQTHLNLRIGINTGPVVAGVIGTKKFSYDIWGDAVNLASRMESSGVPGSIQVSESTYQRLKHLYNFEPRGLIPMKGKGEMPAYLLLSRKQEIACEMPPHPCP
ncbi:adenylate/guanylate cyclase domain-containing protein [Geitlerinema splendidum]|nr:adenylate/guanylate cyclase domain-containing protein [Geitlerinema splendidum]